MLTLAQLLPARVAELVDARDLGSRGATHPSSILGSRTPGLPWCLAIAPVLVSVGA